MTDLEYLNSKVLTTLKVSDNGIGVYAIKDIKKGEFLQNKHNLFLTVTREEFNTLSKDIKDIILDRNVFSKQDVDFTFYNPNSSFDLQSFINHANSPNSNGIIALRDILKDEEITEDYNDPDIDKVSKEHYHFL